MSVLIVGAGPAGARLAIRLASSGWPVVLVDRLTNPSANAFSSAALPIEAVRRLELPAETWSARWQGWQLHDPTGSMHQWWACSDLGVVLDFGKVRSWLWAEARRLGVELLQGCRAHLEELDSSGATVRLTDADQRVTRRRSRWVIDATGAGRGLLGQLGLSGSGSDSLLSGCGVEWLLQANDRTASPWLDRLSFFLGTNWIPYGYGWVFPMAGHQLKVGVCVLPPRSLPGLGLHQALTSLIGRLGLSSCDVLDRHGGPVASTIHRRERMGQNSLLAVGDAASSANLLGGEGIRHAMDSADQLADCLLEQPASLPSEQIQAIYRRRVSTQQSWRWSVSGRLARRTWWGLNNPKADQRLSKLISGLSARASAQDLSDLLFNYRFERYGLRLLPYLI